MIPKFRAWEPDTKFMNDQVRVTSNRFGDGEILVEATDGFGWIEVKPECLMQSTGLKDKNGVEIFEGDIVKNTHNKKIRRVFWNPNRTEFELSEVGHESSRTEYWSLSNPKWSYEIIGNVWETPELFWREQNNEK